MKKFSRTGMVIIIILSLVLVGYSSILLINSLGSRGMLRKALSLEERGHYREAIKVYQEFISKYPQGKPIIISMAHNGIGRCWRSLRKFRKAIEEFKKVAEVSPQLNIMVAKHIEDCEYDLAKKLQKLHHYEEAKKAWEEYISKDPEWDRLYTICSNLAKVTKNKPFAGEFFGRLAESASFSRRSIEVRIALAECNYDLGSYGESIAIYEKVLEKCEHLQEKLKDEEKSYKYFGNREEAYLGLGKAYYRLGNYQEGKKWLEKVSKADPVRTKKTQEYLRLCEVDSSGE